MEKKLSVFNYAEDFNITSALSHLLEHPEPNGLCLTSVGSCIVPIPNDQLVCDKTFNTLLILPRTTYSEFVGFTGFYMTMMADILRNVNTDKTRNITSDGIRIMSGSDIIGLSSSRVIDGIGLHYIPIFLTLPTLKSGVDSKSLTGLKLSDEDINVLHNDIEKQFQQLIRQLFQQEISMRISATGGTK